MTVIKTRILATMVLCDAKIQRIMGHDELVDMLIFSRDAPKCLFISWGVLLDEASIAYAVVTVVGPVI